MYVWFTRCVDGMSGSLCLKFSNGCFVYYEENRKFEEEDKIRYI